MPCRARVIYARDHADWCTAPGAGWREALDFEGSSYPGRCTRTTGTKSATKRTSFASSSEKGSQGPLGQREQVTRGLDESAVVVKHASRPEDNLAACLAEFVPLTTYGLGLEDALRPLPLQRSDPGQVLQVPLVDLAGRFIRRRGLRTH